MRSAARSLLDSELMSSAFMFLLLCLSRVNMLGRGARDKTSALDALPGYGGCFSGGRN